MCLFSISIFVAFFEWSFFSFAELRRWVGNQNNGSRFIQPTVQCSLHISRKSLPVRSSRLPFEREFSYVRIGEGKKLKRTNFELHHRRTWRRIRLVVRNKKWILKIEKIVPPNVPSCWIWNHVVSIVANVHQHDTVLPCVS